jgi:hypothetical protein
MDFTHKIPGINGLAVEHAPEAGGDGSFSLKFLLG